MNSRRVLPAFIALAMGLVLTAPASGQTTTSPITVHARHPPGTETKDEMIKVADLDLKSEAGAETLIGRIRGAARRVCSPRPTSFGNFKDMSDYERCKDEAIEDAVKNSGSAKAMEIIQRTGD